MKTTLKKLTRFALIITLPLYLAQTPTSQAVTSIPGLAGAIGIRFGINTVGLSEAQYLMWLMAGSPGLYVTLHGVAVTEIAALGGGAVAIAAAEIAAAAAIGFAAGAGIYMLATGDDLDTTLHNMAEGLDVIGDSIVSAAQTVGGWISGLFGYWRPARPGLAQLLAGEVNYRFPVVT
ncbi:MAG: hypothetical protein AB7P04_10285 [Bacteriovoracia bacterium]